MGYDYDWVIVGDSDEGRRAALHLVQKQKRVALVQQSQRDRLDASENLFLQGLRQWLAVKGQAQFFRELGLYKPSTLPKLDYAAFKAWIDFQQARRDESLSLLMLAIAGVDVVLEGGEFVRLPELSFVVPSRILRSRRYLIATGSHYSLTDRQKQFGIPCLTPHHLGQVEVLQGLPRSLAVMGNAPMAVVWAQYLQRLGHQLTLAFSPPLLPLQDRDLAHLLQAQLEVEGVQLKESVQPISPDLDAEAIIIVNTPEPNLEGLNLQSVGVKSHNSHLVVNARLQTSNPRIYACGAVLGSWPSPVQIQQELAILTQKRACFSWLKRDSVVVPFCLPTFPPLAQVGLTEAQAKQQFGDHVNCLSFYPPLSWQPEGIEVMKVILLNNRRILGVHLLGSGVAEAIAFFALAIAHKIPWQAIAGCHFIAR